MRAHSKSQRNKQEKANELKRSVSFGRYLEYAVRQAEEHFDGNLSLYVRSLIKRQMTPVNGK